MDWPIDRKTVAERDPSLRSHEAIAAALELAVARSRLRAGDRLPTVRALSGHLGVSAATVAAAYDLLARRGVTNGEVGRGTFVATEAGGGRRSVGRPGSSARREPPGWASLPGAPAAWRRDLLRRSVARLEAAYPEALNCTSGHPDESLLPLTLLQRCWTDAVGALAPRDLQYAGPDPVGAFAEAVAGRLRSDGVPARADDVVVATSTMQLIDLVVRAMTRRAAPGMVAVEDPGYATTHDAFERQGWRPVAVAGDAEGMLPEALDRALRDGALLVLATPRAQNPTGASWSAQRHADLAEVLAAHAQAMIVEDDHAAGIVAAGPCSLRDDERLTERVIHIRSFSKSIAPDLRVAVAVAPHPIRREIVDEKSAADGWTSRLAQRALALLLRDGSLDGVLDHARRVYDRRRKAALAALTAAELVECGATVVPASGGLNLWVGLPEGIEQADVLEHAARLGVLVAPGEPFYVERGRRDAVRLTFGELSEDAAAEAATTLARAIVVAAGVRSADSHPV